MLPVKKFGEIEIDPEVLELAIRTLGSIAMKEREVATTQLKSVLWFDEWLGKRPDFTPSKVDVRDSLSRVYNLIEKLHDAIGDLPMEALALCAMSDDERRLVGREYNQAYAVISQSLTEDGGELDRKDQLIRQLLDYQQRIAKARSAKVLFSRGAPKDERRWGIIGDCMNVFIAFRFRNDDHRRIWTKQEIDDFYELSRLMCEHATGTPSDLKRIISQLLKNLRRDARNCT
ncbi:hypothetical protein JL101_035655 (plasmid) [Skermanella rosea]|uniref:hypothetical protein n=1 Tax=Skermanella rosea TaxID=1817965 RepID=UPI00193159AA|nr:hypothetical protein [Skermanella rosea]UEM08135.1 hypothetical protein JL101_035655 [Skermanella rosea]